MDTFNVSQLRKCVYTHSDCVPLYIIVLRSDGFLLAGFGKRCQMLRES